MNEARSTFQLRANLVSDVHIPAQFDDFKAGRPIERRLNRMERVVVAYSGKIITRMDNGLWAAFHSANTALLGAREMQRRCAVLPQLSRHRFCLRIGIHLGLINQRTEDVVGHLNNTAAQLAVIDNGIVVSDVIVARLDAVLQKFTCPLNSSPIEFSAHTFDWRREISTTALGPELLSPACQLARFPKAFLLLYNGLQTLECTRGLEPIMIGRDPKNDLVLADEHISRYHCWIKCCGSRVILTDTSTNGTTVVPEVGEELLVKNASVEIKGKGLLFLGRPFHGERRGSIRYETC